MRCAGANYPQMFRSLRVVCQLFLIDGDCGDCGRHRLCHLWGSFHWPIMSSLLLADNGGASPSKEGSGGGIPGLNTQKSAPSSPFTHPSLHSFDAAFTST